MSNIWNQNSIHFSSIAMTLPEIFFFFFPFICFFFFAPFQSFKFEIHVARIMVCSVVPSLFANNFFSAICTFPFGERKNKTYFTLTFFLARVPGLYKLRCFFFLFFFWFQLQQFFFFFFITFMWLSVMSAVYSKIMMQCFRYIVWQNSFKTAPKKKTVFLKKI